MKQVGPGGVSKAFRRRSGRRNQLRVVPTYG